MTDTAELLDLHPSENNVRKRISKEDQAELNVSIHADGIRVPIIIRARTDGDGFTIVEGHRRVDVARGLGWTAVPVIVQDLDDAEALKTQVVANLRRADLHPLDEALALKALLEQEVDGREIRNVEDVAAMIGKAEPYVRQRLKLNDLSASAMAAFDKGVIALSMALEIARLPKIHHAEALTLAKDSTVDFFRNRIERRFFLNLKDAPFDVEAKSLVRSAGSCGDCPKRTGRQTGLFVGMSDDTCTDPKCYDHKVKIHVNNAVDKICAEGGKGANKFVRRISESAYFYGPDSEKTGEKVLVSTDWRKATKEDGDSYRIGVIEDGVNRGTVLKIVIGKAAKPKKTEREKADSVAKRKDRLANKRKAEVEKRVRSQALTMALSNQRVGGAEVNRPMLEEAVLRGLWGEVWHETRRAILDFLGVDEKDAYDKAHRLRIGKVLDAAIGFEPLVSILAVGKYLREGEPKDVLMDLVKASGVSVDKVRKAIVEEMRKSEAISASTKKKAPKAKKAKTTAVKGGKSSSKKKAA